MGGPKDLLWLPPGKITNKRKPFYKNNLNFKNLKSILLKNYQFLYNNEFPALP
jgi:hypothetical protein